MRDSKATRGSKATRDSKTALNANRLVRELGKPPEEFTRADLIGFIERNGIEMINFRHLGGDGRLKALNFVVTDRVQLDRALSAGERVDGSSLFAYIDAASSDLYIVPRYKTAFVNPFTAAPTLDFLCSYYTREGEPLASSPENILRRAHSALREKTGYGLEAMGELEYYIFYERQPLYPIPSQKGYQESEPFVKWEQLRSEVMLAVARAGGQIKYAHSEVGNIGGGDLDMEQQEIEFEPVAAEDAADQLVLAKWMLRMIGRKHGVTITTAPKIMVGHAGSGLHIHSRLMKNGRNAMVDKKGLSEAARRTIAGYLELASSLTAFGNTVPTAYLRLVPHQEAPTNVCWGDRNRSVLVRVPLGWHGVGEMARDANPQEKGKLASHAESQTVELRSPDGSANVHLLLAGLAVAARHGLEMKNALEVAERLYVDVNIFDDAHKKVQEKLPQLPSSCGESAERLLKDRAIYEKGGVFPPMVIDGTAKELKAHDDKDLSERLYGKEEEIAKLVEKHLHCG